jgi:hypothetical protein
VTENDRLASYRQKAVEAERLAATVRDVDAQKALRLIADSYWLLADERDMPSQDGKPKHK